MCLAIVPKDQLSNWQSQHIEKLLAAREHIDDLGPPRFWSIYSSGLYAVVHGTFGAPIGLVEASGPMDAVNPGWWLASDFRGKGYGLKLVDALAIYLKEHGYTGAVSTITIQTNGGVYDVPSRKLAKRFQWHFS